MISHSTRISNLEYHAAHAIGSSSLKRILRSPAHYEYERQNPTPPTPDMIFGTHLHSAVLEPSAFWPNIVTCPEFKGPGCVQKRLDWAEAQKGKYVLEQDDIERLEAMRDAIRKHPIANAMLHGGTAELSFFGVDESTGIEIKARPDYLHADGMIIDLKSTVDASPEGFPRQAVNYGYALSAWQYSMLVAQVTGKPMKKFAIVAVEKKPPYCVACYVLDAEWMKYGERQYNKAITMLAHARRSGRFEGYPEHVMLLDLPRYLSQE